MLKRPPPPRAWMLHNIWLMKKRQDKFYTKKIPVEKCYDAKAPSCYSYKKNHIFETSNVIQPS